MDEPANAGRAPNILMRPPTFSSDHASHGPSGTQMGSGQDNAHGICRICRGEGTPDEPLFYPCKCSGSIKYVHQECLMEWLSHSQKKYCELCKTPFRFTKLYAPDMPQSLPVHVFLQHMARYLVRNLMTWARAILAISVWICWLPYIMRLVWTFLFWVSDEGFGSSPMLSHANTSAGATIELSSTILGMETCPASPLYVPTSTSAASAEALLSADSGQTASEFFARLFLGGIGQYLVAAFVNDGKGSVTDSPYNSTLVRGSTLLGDVEFLQKLTSNPLANRIITMVLEGQIITILVIVCFILVILVRDYVVQQQPEINMRAAFVAPDEQPQAELQPVPQVEVQPPFGEDAEHEIPQPPQEEHNETESDTETLEDEGNHHHDDEVRPRSTSELDEIQYDTAAEAGTRDEEVVGHETEEYPFVPAAELANNERSTRDRRGSTASTVQDYLRIYRQADGDRERILEQIEAEGLQDRLQYWVDITKRGQVIAQDGDLLPELTDFASDRQIPTSEGNSSDSSQRDYLDPVRNHERPEWEPFSPRFTPDANAASSASHAGSSRPRSVSDGPQPASQSNPLGNNSWSFNNLPPLDQPEHEQHDFQAIGHVTPPASELEEPASPNSAWTSVNEGSIVHEDDDHLQEHELILEADDSVNLDDAEDLPGLPQRDLLNLLNDQNHNAEVRAPPDLAVVLRRPDTPDEAGANLQGPQPNGVFARLRHWVFEFMWGGLGDQEMFDMAAEQIPIAGADANPEDAWVDEVVDQVVIEDENGNPADGAEMLDAGAGLDPEAIDDLEDFEGVMELIGMRGPLAGLFQNAIFCAVLVTVTIFACIFFPYNIGRLSIWITANPMRLARMLFEVSKLIQDATLCAAGLVSWFLINLVDIFTNLIGGEIARHIVVARKASWVLWTGAGSRVVECVLLDFPLSASEMQNFSAVSHEALLGIKNQVSSVVSLVDSSLGSLLAGKITVGLVANTTATAFHAVANASKSLSDPSSWVLDFSAPDKPLAIDPALAYWPGDDRFWAIFAGYATIFIVGALYLKRGAQFARGTMMQAWEAGFIDTLHQASGIIKVIVIISIEMLVFPLYCGLLLDGALLPLFGGATFSSRTAFTYNYPLTSIFVHWFVGTGYMFHFALFVSMCRKIMRPGVLYFIRDPDDPEFHPVRDVLERNLTTQLRKILFSAFVYGALVVVCLGGVVWGLSWTLPSVLPIHYSSNEPILEFPVDLLFYNFLMPLAVKFFKPSDGLHTMYTWWFRKCARGLHLTYFLFGERRIDEEGALKLTPDSAHHQEPFYRKLFLQLNGDSVEPMTWEDTFVEEKTATESPTRQETIAKSRRLQRKKQKLVASGQLVREGHFVRAPASDRIKIPKKRQVFLPVNERNEREDGRPDSDNYNSPLWRMVYIPPHFRARVFLFILYIWIFAAVTGVGLTIIPLMLGRLVFKSLIPDYVRTNDIYAFSIGVYLLGSAAYGIYYAGYFLDRAKEQIQVALWSMLRRSTAGKVASGALRVAKLAYAYFFMFIFFPLLLSGLIELYVALPLHTYLHPPTSISVITPTDDTGVSGRHTVRLVQAWTLGLLYLKLTTKLIGYSFRDTRLCWALDTILRRGWLQPDVGILTRAFIVPGLVIAVAAIAGPPALTTAGVSIYMQHKYGADAGHFGTEVEHIAWQAKSAILHRASYPLAAFLVLTLRNIARSVIMLKGWSARVRDEAYLIGERLHNFGVASDAARRGREWKARGARL